MTFWSVDRLEGRFAVCETQDGHMVSLALEELPDGIREGSVLRVLEGGLFLLDVKEEKRRREEAFRLQAELFSGEK